MRFGLNEYLAHFVGELNRRYAEALEELSAEQLYFRINDETNHIGFIAWHWLRTQDNILNFICQERKPTVWLRQDLNAKWGLPKAAQGTGMERREAHALEVPDAAALVDYARAVNADVQPYLQGVTGEDLERMLKVNPWGERPTLQHIGQTVIAHGSAHLGQIHMLRAAQTLPGEAF